jgi:ABC-2 type transport system ATP-binding protein
MIEVDRLTKIYGNNAAVDSISFRVERGEILGFLGPNGAGKSTTMKILTTFLPATMGTARVSGFDVFDQAFEVKKLVGFVPENPPLYNELSVTAYLKFAAELHGVPKKKIRERLDFVITHCDLSGFKNRLIGNLSKGMRQRVSLAQAIIHDPKVLILDEPTIGLDPAQVIEFRKLIKTFAGDHTVILSTHILSEVEALCSRVVIINRGKLLADEKLDKLSESLARKDYTEISVRHFSEGVVSSLRALPGIERVEKMNSGGGIRLSIEGQYGEEGRSEIAKLAVEKGWGLTRLNPRGMSLEDIYLRLISTQTSAGTAGVQP